MEFFLLVGSSGDMRRCAAHFELPRQYS